MISGPLGFGIRKEDFFCTFLTLKKLQKEELLNTKEAFK
jgi:hypothetical protein